MIDTNVVVQWLMVKKIIQFAILKFHLGNKLFGAYEARYEPSFDFVNKALESTEDKHKFVITELSLNEVFSGLRDEVRSFMLFTKGVPISRWTYKRETKEARINEELLKEIYELTMQGFDILVENIEIIPTINPSDMADYFEVYASLIFLNPELTTQDAMLITTAIFEHVNYFVTRDKDLIRLDSRLMENYGLEVVKPQRAVQIMTR